MNHTKSRYLVRITSSVLLVGMVLFSQPATTHAQEGGLNIDSKILEIDIKRGDDFKLLDLLKKWGGVFGHTIVAGKQLNAVTMRFHTLERQMTWGVFKKVMAMYGVTAIEEEVSPGRLLIRIELQRAMPNQAPPFKYIKKGEKIPTRDEIVTAVIQVRHGAGAEIFQAVRQLKRRDRRRVGDIFHVRGPEVIIIADLAPNVRFYERIIRELDVEAPSQKIHIRKLRWSIASELTQVLTQILQPRTGGGATGGRGGARPAPGGRRPGGRVPAGPVTSGAGGQTAQAQIIAFDPTNQLLIRCLDYQLAEIDQLIKELDIRIRAPGAKFHVYKCHDADSEELAAKLQELFTGQATTVPQRRTSGGTTGSTGSTFGGAGGRNTGRNTGNTGLTNTRNTRNTRNNTRTNTTRRLGGLGGAGSNALDVRIIPDELTNSILVQAEEDDYIVVLQLLRQLDRKRRRVLIEAEVWEMSANDDLLITTELASTQNTHNGSIRPLGVTSFGASDVSTDATGTRFSRGPGSLSVDGNGNPVLSLGTGLTTFITRDEIDKIPILLQTLQGYSKSRRVTTPFALTNDNEEATFRVTDRQPFQTTTINNVASQQNVQFVDAESTLTVTPTVNNDDSMTLNVNLVVSSFGARSDPNLPPPTNSREYQGTVTVPNGKFVVFGGLDSVSTSFTERKTPLLGDIPILGYLFKSWRRNKTLSRLYIFIRPVIFSSTEFRQDILASSDLLKKAHIEAEEEKWVPTIIPSRLNRKDGDLQDRVFEVFGTGSASPFGGR